MTNTVMRRIGFWPRSALRTVMEVPAYPTLIVLIILAWIVQPRLLTLPFLMIVLRQAAPLGVLALGQLHPMIGRSIDMSIGGVIALCNVLLAMPMIANGPAAGSVLLPLAVGGLVGLANAFLIARLRASAVVVTLGMSIVLVGISYIVSGGAPGGEVNAVIEWLGSGRWGRFPIAGAVLFALTALCWFALKKGVFGHGLYALGSSFGAAFLGGVPVNRSLVMAHVAGGLLAGVAAILLTGYIGTGTLNLGADLVLASVAAVVLGGTSFGGGTGGALGALAGALALTFLANLLTGMGVGKPAQLIIQGAIIVVAAGLAKRRSH
ncbi:ABC transporter permease [Martelella soudanensis]|uniref:ABC transporter permease n=1 Tax=unclassified Martelella TaxID=2629616 RepID=UPI0015DF245A|nr:MULTISPECIES: ABC transporter permease [unclassified Martelella]